MKKSAEGKVKEGSRADSERVCIRAFVLRKGQRVSHEEGRTTTPADRLW